MRAWPDCRRGVRCIHYYTINNIAPPVKNPVLFCRRLHILTCGRKNFQRWRRETGPMPGRGVLCAVFACRAGQGEGRRLDLSLQGKRGGSEMEHGFGCNDCEVGDIDDLIFAEEEYCVSAR